MEYDIIIIIFLAFGSFVLSKVVAYHVYSKHMDKNNFQKGNNYSNKLNTRKGVEEYLSLRGSGINREYVNAIKENITCDQKILEIGSGPAIDYDYLVSEGYSNLTPSDFSEIFIEDFSRKHSNKTMEKVDLINFNYAKKGAAFEAIILCNVLDDKQGFDINKEEGKRICENIYDSLVKGGIFIGQFLKGNEQASLEIMEAALEDNFLNYVELQNPVDNPNYKILKVIKR